ncbi:hypothetical protein BFV94_4393 [Alteromonas macleodii]|uniref:Uncharacterized protein n=2 Tax=Alteromonas macleodii TaxID=28108 RepID=A0AB36FKT7_ALTMA|nr:hypothetical protein BFV95_4750 [Alteromonas macleodii]OES25540.1 hypothetical protein BFV94_4393 [Alteromonas macleodii]OES25841.1 hypothetical protein BFV93_4304 [Alteromonas macleodii]OES38637.1 hypothetical protein BFV96_4748 [Alteromonas macleodii]
MICGGVLGFFGLIPPKSGRAWILLIACIALFFTAGELVRELTR